MGLTAIIFFLIFGFFTPSIVSADTAHTTQWNWISSSDKANGPNDGNYVAVAVSSPIWYIPGTGWNIPSNATITSMDVYTYTTGTSYAIWLEGNPGNACGEGYGTRLHTFTGANCSMTFTPANMNDGTTIYMRRWIFENFNVDAVKVRINYTTPEITPTPTATPTPTPSTSPTPAPFLDLPWDYKSQEKILEDEVLRAGSWFDHQYPLQNIFGINKVVQYTGEELDLPYRSHSGYDYNRQNSVDYRTPVLAAASGTATLKIASHSAGAGNIIKIDHPNGYQTWYEHLDPTGMIVPDENTKVSVEKGQKIGETGFTGNVYPPNQDGAHIHLSVFKDINNNGNFEDDYPFGLNDPLGWDGKYTDPWTQWTSDPPEKLDKRYGAKSYKLFLSLKNPKEAPIATSGGELIDDKIKVSVPSDASFVPFILTLKYGPFESGDLLRGILPSFFLSAINNLGENISPFILPIQIIYDYADANLFNIKEETLKLYHFNENTKAWDDLPSTVDTENKKVIASTISFSHFALMGEIKDKIPPNTEIVIYGDKGQDDWYRSKVIINLNGEDNAGGLGLKHTLYTVNGDNWIEYGGPLTFNEDRAYTITYESSDNAYNIENLKTASFSIDRTPPVSTANITDGTNGQNDWYTTDVEVALSADDQNGSGIEKIEYSLNGSDFLPYTPPLLIASEVENELKFRSIDKAGNVEVPQILKIKIDKTPPDTLLYITGTRGSEDWYRTNVQVAFNAADEKSGYNTTYYSLDEGDNKKFTEYTEIPPLILNKEEITKIYYYSVDNAGNKEDTRMREIKIDKTPPVASINASPDSIWPPNGKMVNVKISGISTDSHLKTTTFDVKDEYGLIQPTLTDFGQTIQLEAKRNGDDVDGRSYTIQATAKDLAGNITPTKTTVTVPHDQGK